EERARAFTGAGGPARAHGLGPRAFGQAGRWAAAVTAVALGLFLCTPRVTEARWAFAAPSGRAPTGPGENPPGIDLDRRGSQAPRRVRAEPVASPVGPDGQPRVLLVSRGGDSDRYSWIGQRAGEPSPPAFASQHDYIQVVLPNAEAGVGQPVPLEESTLEHLR